MGKAKSAMYTTQLGGHIMISHALRSSRGHTVFVLINVISSKQISLKIILYYLVIKPTFAKVVSEVVSVLKM